MPQEIPRSPPRRGPNEPPTPGLCNSLTFPLYVYIYIYICKYMYMDIYIYICIYIYTCTYRERERAREIYICFHAISLTREAHRRRVWAGL